MKHESAAHGDALEVSIKMGEACCLLVVLCPIGIGIAVLWVDFSS